MTTNTNIMEIGLTAIDGEPRARDLDVGERLGFERSRKIRDLIQRNLVEFERFGSLAPQRGKSRGQEFTEFWLNEEQCLLAAVLSDAPHSAEVRAMLIRVFVAWRRGHLPAVDQQSLARQIAAIVDDKLSRANAAMVSKMLPTAVAGYLADHNLAVADGITAGEVCDLAKVATKYPKGVSGRVSRRLTQFCIRNGERPRVQRMGRVRAQLFPTQLVRDWLDVEGRALIQRWLEEKKGQGTLRLVTGSAE